MKHAAVRSIIYAYAKSTHPEWKLQVHDQLLKGIAAPGDDPYDQGFVDALGFCVSSLLTKCTPDSLVGMLPLFYLCCTAKEDDLAGDPCPTPEEINLLSEEIKKIARHKQC